MWEIEDHKKRMLSLEEAKFVFEQGEKQLIDSIETNNSIINRTNVLLTLIAGVLVAFLGVVANKIELKSYDSILLSSLIGSIYLIGIGGYIVTNMSTKKYVLHGELPKNYFDDIFFPKNYTGNNRLLWYYIDAIQQYQKRILLNKQTNKQYKMEYI